MLRFWIETWQNLKIETLSVTLGTSNLQKLFGKEIWLKAKFIWNKNLFVEGIDLEETRKEAKMRYSPWVYNEVEYKNAEKNFCSSFGSQK